LADRLFSNHAPNLRPDKEAYLIVVWLVSLGLGSNLEGCRLDRGCVSPLSAPTHHGRVSVSAGSFSEPTGATARWSYFEDRHRR
jgi:hypothetical protein